MRLSLENRHYYYIDKRIAYLEEYDFESLSTVFASLFPDVIYLGEDLADLWSILHGYEDA